MVFPAVTNGCERWTIRKAECLGYSLPPNYFGHLKNGKILVHIDESGSHYK